MEKEYRKNERIRAPQVNLIDEAGNQLGTLSTKEALRLAEERSLDLVEIGPNANPPVARIMDYGRFIYEKEKKHRKEKKSSAELKTIRIGFRTGRHDLETKARQIEKFLTKGHRIRADIKLRGREKGMANMAKQKLTDFLKLINRPYVIEGEPKRTPFGWSIGIHHGQETKNQQIGNEAVQNNR